MPKRKLEDKICYYENKLQTLREKSTKKKKRVIVYSSSSDSENNEDGTRQDDVGVNLSENINLNENFDTFDNIESNNVPSETNVQNPSEQKFDEKSDLDPELLLALGDPVDEQPIYGENIHQSIVQRLVPILKKGLSNETKEKLLKYYNIPENCKFLKAPTLNPEISAALSEMTRNRDKNIQNKQDQLGLGITAVTRAVTSLLLSDDKLQAIKMLTDSCRILSDLHHTETDVRKRLITPCLDKPIISVIKEQDRDETLFGNTLSETIKASKAIERQGQQIKKPNLLQRTTSLPGSSYSAFPSTSRTRFQGNAMGSPRYLSANRGGRGGPPRPPPTYRRPAPPAPPPHFRPPTTSQYPRQRAPTRR